jgi:Ca-activated chloride channel homolog
MIRLRVARPFLQLALLKLVMLELAMLGCAIAASAQLPSQQPPTIHATTNLVDLSFTARAPNRSLISGLKREDIELFEDAAPQKIAFFSQASDVPLTLGLIVDASSSQDHFTKDHQHALELFLKELLRPQDSVFLVCFGNHLRLASDFTNSADEVLRGMDRYQHHDRDHIPEIGPSEDRELGTAFYDSIFYAITEKLAPKQGRKALLVFSDGEDNSSSHDMMDTIEAAQAANVLVYTIRWTELSHGKLTARNKYGTSVMNRIAKETGAATVDTSKTDAKVYLHDIADELRNSYDVAYYPTNKTQDGTFRKVAIHPLSEGVTIRTRTGYLSR